MSPQSPRGRGCEQEGSASVELVAILPFLLLAVLAAAQIGLAGQALWAAGVAARAGARAALVGGDPRAAARSALPPSLRRAAAVGEDGGVSVRVPVPRVLPGMPELMVGTEASLGDDGQG